MNPSRARGFTIVELLIVIVVIAILATITTVAYNGIQNRARSSAAQALANQTATKIAAYTATEGTYPSDLASAGVTDATDLQYSVNTTSSPATYCLTATNGNVSYFTSSTQSTPQSGGCPGHGTGGVAAITNLVTNPSVETNLTGYGLNNANLVTRTRDTAAGYNGTYGQRLSFTSAGTFGGVGPYIQVTNLASDKSYTASVWIRSSTSVKYAISLERRNASNTNIGTATGNTVTLTPNTWTRLTTTIPPTATMTQLTFCVYQQSSTVAIGDTVDIDGFMFTEGTSTPNYADGSSTNWVWNGTAHSATSTGPAL